MTGVLTLRGYGVAFGDNVVLRSIDLEVPSLGVTTLMGPGGAGKSTLVRTLAGHNDAQPLLRTWGEARYDDVEPPFLLAQSARLMIATVFENVLIGLRDRHRLTHAQQRERVRGILGELGLRELAETMDARVIDLPLGLQRALAVARGVAAETRLLVLDEPSVGLDDRARDALLATVVREGARRAVLYVTHHRGEALSLGGTVALLVGGRIVESAPAAQFFDAPVSPTAKHFVATGTCYLDPRDLDSPEEEPPPSTARQRPSLTATFRPPTSARVSVPRIPTGLHWVKRGALAGLPRPGLLADVDEELAGLASLGIGTLITLEETRTIGAELLARHNLDGVWFPVPDMAAPPLDETYSLCVAMRARIVAGDAIAVHCRAGLGRTGTILAAYLVFEGLGALEALESVRCQQPRFVQSDEQIEFLSAFAGFCRAAERDVSTVA